LDSTANEFIMIFETMEDEYMRERAADIKDIRTRLLCALKGINLSSLQNITEKVILVADDLAPSDTAVLNLDYILGFITKEGGVTSHVSIMAKGLGLPALVGVNSIMNEVTNGDFLIMDAKSGNIIINPDEKTIKEYQGLQEEYERKQNELAKESNLPAVTLDGRSVHLCANVGSIYDIKQAIKHGIDGVGLFRSEFLYMENNHFPTEEEQFKAYQEAAILVGKELTIRTLDIGGDKSLSYYEFEKEENPFLGWRAIRISLELKDMFKTQLRAILRASAFGTIRIMFPMIISMEELRTAKEILNECKLELTEESIAFDTNIQVGMMMETPASVLCAEDFAKEVDFFSIGTNDLTQYMLAVDRGNKKIANMYNSFHPAVLKSIKHIIKAGHNNNIKVGMCGEFACDERAIPVLLGLGLDEFSMSAMEIANVKHNIRNLSYESTKFLADKICNYSTIDEINLELERVIR
ncbi:MAG: phosphoenolpyruvate-protein phosphotransferase PtsI, partial [Anaerocolumna sp.]|nr:phosphoenolpyruvate-protein phosphotransferase PtsI [Anaerocolumna sp.]